jgi:peptidoglycan hydrolase CwlO-like protein
MTAVEYLNELKKIVKQGYELVGEKELQADLDSIASQIDSTLYKIKELKESMGLSNYLKESLNEAKSLK